MDQLKCGSIILNNITINGKKHNLQNRKFCLICSPFKRNNRSVKEPFSKAERIYAKCNDERKDMIKCCLYKRALERKAILIKKLGGGCSRCGYSKCTRALCFHHRDRSEKLFGLSLNNLWSKTMGAILNESSKCDLLCANCHSEIEDEIDRKTSIINKVNEKYGTDF